jgi:hypothetical protein
MATIEVSRNSEPRLDFLGKLASGDKVKNMWWKKLKIVKATYVAKGKFEFDFANAVEVDVDAEFTATEDGYYFYEHPNVGRTSPETIIVATA